MSTPLRVCHVVNAVSETSIPAQIATGLARYTNVEATVLAWFNAGEFPNDDQVRVVSLDTAGRIGDIQSARRVVSLFRQHDVVHTHHNHAGAYGKLLANIARRPVVSTEHNSHTGFEFSGQFANGTTNALADRITCVSQSVCDSFTWWENPLVSPEKRTVIHNGVDIDCISDALATDWRLRDALGIEENLIVGIAAMHTEQKAHDVLINAVARANDRLSEDIHLVVTGNGPLRSSLENLSEDRGIEELVHFLGIINTEKLYRTLYEIDILSMPSRWEGFCVAVAETMAVGTPCILSDIDVFNEIYGDVALTHPVDDERTLATRLVELAQDPKTRASLSEQGRTLIENKYSLERAVQAYAELYSHLVENV